MYEDRIASSTERFRWDGRRYTAFGEYRKKKKGFGQNWRIRADSEGETVSGPAVDGGLEKPFRFSRGLLPRPWDWRVPFVFLFLFCFFRLIPHALLPCRARSGGGLVIVVRESQECCVVPRGLRKPHFTACMLRLA